MSDFDDARSRDDAPPDVKTVITTADASVASAVADTTATMPGQAISDRPSDMRALFERSWARHEAGYRRLAER
jgi:hypothetical protein